MLLPWLAEFLHSATVPRRRSSFRPRVDGLEERVVPAFDLQLHKVASAGMVSAGSYVTYNVTVAKYGDEPVTLAVVRDTLPAGMEFVHVSATRGATSFHAPSNQVTWSVGEFLDSGSMETMSITVRAVSPGVITNTAMVYAPGQTEFDTSNNVAAVAVQVLDPTPPPESLPPPPPPTPADEVSVTPQTATAERFITVGPQRRGRLRARSLGLRPAFRSMPRVHLPMQFRNFAA